MLSPHCPLARLQLPVPRRIVRKAFEVGASRWWYKVLAEGDDHGIALLQAALNSKERVMEGN